MSKRRRISHTPPTTVWEVVFRPGRVAKEVGKQSRVVRERLADLIAQFVCEGPVQAEWPHYSQLFG